LSDIHAVKLAKEWDQGIADLIRIAREHDAVVSEVPAALTDVEARRIINDLASERRIDLRGFDQARPSRFGTLAYRMRETDGKGIVYCHADGPLRGRAFHARKGIGWYYEHRLGGSESQLGLPTSDEELISSNGFATSHFEGGYIEWSPKTKVARAVQYTPQGDRTIDDHKL
jgi:hypothetical protein